MQPTEKWFIRPGGLASRLEAIRKAASLTQVQIGKELNWHRTKLSKLESGRQLPTEQDVRDLTRMCGADDELNELLDLLKETRAVHREFRHSLRQGMVSIQGDFGAMVRDAAVIRAFELVVMPGLVQTTDYARHRMLENVRLYGLPPEQVGSGTAARVRNQEVLYDTDHQFQFMVMEAALYARVCPPAVMLGQLDRLEQLSALPNVQIGVIPDRWDARHEPDEKDLNVTPLHGFWIMDDITYIETIASETVVRGEEASAYVSIADAIWEQASKDDEARALIAAAAAKWRTLL